VREASSGALPSLARLRQNACPASRERGSVRLNCYEWGDPASPTLVLVHGVTGHGERFAPLAAGALAERFHLIAPDLRGHGRSGWEPPWSLEQHVEDLLETAPPGALAWVGHSFGGRLVLELAGRSPERVSRALLLDPALWVPPPLALAEAEALRPDVSFATLEEAVEARLASGADHGARRELLERDFGAHLERGADGRLRFRYSPAAAIAAYGEMARTPPLAPLTRPLRVARAVESHVCPVELVEAVRESAGELLTLVELPGGHTTMWDAPAETAAAIAEFLLPAGEETVIPGRP
jgi:lipase